MSIARSIGALVLLAALAAGVSAQQPAAPAKPAAPAAPAQPAAPAAPAAPAFDVQVKNVEAIHAIVLPMKGSYMQHPDAFGRLGTATSPGAASRPRARRSGATSATRPWARPTSCGRSASPCPPGRHGRGAVRDQGPPGGARTPCTSHQGPMEEIGTAWGSMIEWVMSNGYMPVRPRCRSSRAT